MPYTDTTFEQRRAKLLKGTPTTQPSSGGFSSGGGFVDSSFEQRRKQIYSAPIKTTTPIRTSSASMSVPKPTFLQQTGQNAASFGSSVLSGLGEFTQQAERQLKGFFTPKNGKGFEILSPPKDSPTIMMNPKQVKSIKSIKIGEKLPGFEPKESGSSAQITPKAQKISTDRTKKMNEKIANLNLMDRLINKPADYILNDTGPIGEGIKKFASDLYNSPIETMTPGIKGSVLRYTKEANPELYKKIEDSDIYKFEEAGIQGIMQGALRTYANWNPRVESFLDKELASIAENGTDQQIAGNTVGNIIGMIGSFILGGEILAGLKFGKIALPATFATLGQTSLPSSTPAEARARNLIVDTVSGTLLEYIKPLANLQKMKVFEKGVTYTKQLSKSMTILSSQTYLDARSVGASDEQAKEMVKDSMLILLGIHGFMITGKAGAKTGEYLTRSKFKEGTFTFTPEQAKSVVVGSDIENTPAGREIMRRALEAEGFGKNLRIDLVKATKSKIAGLLNLDTPNGSRITQIELVDGTQPPKVAAPKTTSPVAPKGEIVPNTYYRGMDSVKDPLMTTKSGSFGSGVYLFERSQNAQDFSDNVVTIKSTKNLNLYTPSETEFKEILKLKAQEKDDYIQTLVGNKYDGLKIVKPEGYAYGTAGADEIVVTNKDLLTVDKGTPAPKGSPLVEKAKEHATLDEFIDSQDTTKIIRGTNGLTADQIMEKYPDIQLKKDVPAKDIYGNKVEIPEGESLTPYELKGNKVLLQDGKTYIVSKNQYANIKGQSISGEAKPFAPEMKGLGETMKGDVLAKTEADIKWTGSKDNLTGKLGDRTFLIKKEQDGYYVAEKDGLLGRTARNYTDVIEVLNRYLKEQTPRTRYSNYTLPKGKNYKEILVRAPETKTTYQLKNSVGKIIEESTNHDKLYDRMLKDPSLKIDYNPDIKGFKSSHWDEPNVIAHIRLNERTYKGQNVTFLEEIQSDWAREGRKQGFNTSYKKDEIKFIGEDKFFWRYKVPDNELQIAKSEYPTKEKAIQRVLDKKRAGVPFNSLIQGNKWQELAVKRALIEAITNGSEYFVWINGEQTSARYNLATHVKDVSWKLENRASHEPKEIKQIKIIPNNQNYNLLVEVDKDGKVLSAPAQMNAVGKKLDEVLGKGLADKIMADETGKLSGEGLKFGGEWAVNLYDKQVKNIVEKLTGEKVEVIDLGLPIEKGQTDLFIQKPGGKVRLEIEDLKVGEEIAKSTESWIITDVLGDGKFKAIAISKFEGQGQLSNKDMVKWAKDNPSSIETFDILEKTTTQQGIKITPEIKAKIKGEAPDIKTSGQIGYSKEELTKAYNEAKGIKEPTMKINTPTVFKNPLEEKAFTKITNDPEKFISEYEQAFENEVSPDLALTLFEGYQGHNAGELARATGTAKEIVYNDLLDTQQGIKNNIVLLTSGGSGSGKTTAIQKGEPLKDEYSIVLDTTFSNNSAIKDIQKALNKGYKVDVAFTFRNPAEAWTDGALKRVGEEGRVVSEGYFLKSHINAQKNIIKAYNKYKTNSKVTFTFVENTSDQSHSEVSFDKIKEHLYDRSILAEAIANATENAYEKQQITKLQYEALRSDREQTGEQIAQESPSGTEREISGQSTETVREALRVSSSGYGAAHPWFYKEGEIPLLPSEIKIEAQNDVSMFDPEQTESQLAFFTPKGKLTDKVLENLATLKEADLKTTTAKYKELVDNGMDALTDPNPDQEMLNTALSLAHNHVYHNEFVLALIERYNNPPNFLKKHPPVEINSQEVNPPLPDNTGGGVPQQLSIGPSEADTPDKVSKEIRKLDLPATVWKTKRDSSEMVYIRPSIGKAEFKILVDNSSELRNNPVLKVDKDKNLVFDGENVHFTLNPEALQISTNNIKEGDEVKIDVDALKGRTQQMRISDDKGVLGFNPKNLQNPFSEVAQKETDKIIKQSEIAKELSKKLNVPIRRGKFRHAGAIGIYSPKNKVVRIKSGGLNTIFHEVAHYLDDTIGFSKDISITERELLMSEYGVSYSGQPEKQKKEAFAEYMRFRMTGQTEKINQWGPEFDKVFNEKIKEIPEVDNVINTATEDFKRWNQQPAVAKILSHLSIGGEKPGPLKDRVVNKLHELYTLTLDDLHPLNEFSSLYKKQTGQKLPSPQDPYVLARNLKGWMGKADLFLNGGTFGKEFWKVDKDGKTRMNFTGKGYTEIMDPVMDHLDDFRVYIVSQRIVNDLAPREIVSGIDLKDAKTAITELENKYPNFERVAEERRQYKDALLDYAKDNGLIGEEGLKKIKKFNKYHVPFYRVMEESGAKFLGKSKIGGNLNNPIKKIKGSEREIIDPLESDIKDTYAIINAAERNNIGVAMANVSGANHELGRLFEEVVKPMKPVTVNVQEVMDKVTKGTELEDIDFPEELGEMMVTLFRPTYATGPNMLNVNMGDKQKVFEVDPDLFKSIQGMNVEDVSMIMKILGFPAKALRAGATLSPDFSVRNPLRDQFTAGVYSEHGFVPGVDLIRGVWELIQPQKFGRDTYNLWKAGGGEQAMLVSMDRKGLQKDMKELFATNGERIITNIKNPLKVLQMLSELGEAGTRLGEMRNALARGKDPIESAFASRNVTLDFNRLGSWTRGANGIIAFFGANLNGTDTMVRSFKNRPFQTLWKALFLLTLPSILLYLANRKDKRWKEIPQWQKNMFWIIMTPDHIWRIPKPFELGSLFASVPERVMEAIDTKDPTIMNELANNIADGFTPGWMPTAIIPIVENLSNYSIFLDRPIVSRGKESYPSAQQYGPYTTETSKILGEVVNYSPAKIDNLVNGYGAGLGKYAMSGMDAILVGTGIVVTPPKPAKTLEEMPVIKAFMVRDPIGSGSESVNRVYNEYAQTNAEWTYIKKMVKDGDVEKAKAYAKNHPNAIDAITYTGAVDTFSTLNKAVDLIKQSENMNPQEKADRIKKIQTLQTEIAQKTLAEIKSRKK